MVVIHGHPNLNCNCNTKLVKPTLKYRLHRGDMIETYKITHGLYDTAVVPNLMMSQVSHTTGNMYKLQKMHSNTILENIFLLKEL